MTPVSASITPAESALLRAVGRVAARYSVYPPSATFAPGHAADAQAAFGAPRETADEPLALYIHLPFCHAACAFCRCHKIVTGDGGKAVRYLDYLAREIAAHARSLGERRAVSRMCWGGGTPTYYTASQLRRIWGVLKQHFTFAADGDYAIEIDPRTVDEAVLAELREMGYTHAAVTVPDLDAAVLAAVARPQSAEQSLEAIRAATRAGFGTVAVDVMYGLPHQSPHTLVATLDAIVAAKPDRIVLHEYIHAPRRHKGQRQIAARDVPRGAERLAMLSGAADRLSTGGYVHLAADCFARAGDPLVAAQAGGRLCYDMTGYGTAGATNVLGIGVSAIGATRHTYTQNETDLGAYYDRINAGGLAIARGITLAPDDLVRREVIRLLLCRGCVAYADVEARCSVVFGRYFAAELKALAPYAEAGLVRIGSAAIEVEPRGRLWLRNLCAVFDRYRGARGEGHVRAGSLP